MGRKNKRRRSDYDRLIYMNKYIDQIGRKYEEDTAPTNVDAVFFWRHADMFFKKKW